VGVYKSRQFTKTLPEIISRYHWQEIEQGKLVDPPAN